jgi:hypothetical protein
MQVEGLLPKYLELITVHSMPTWKTVTLRYTSHDMCLWGLFPKRKILCVFFSVWPRAHGYLQSYHRCYGRSGCRNRCLLYLINEDRTVLPVSKALSMIVLLSQFVPQCDLVAVGSIIWRQAIKLVHHIMKIYGVLTTSIGSSCSKRAF